MPGKEGTGGRSQAQGQEQDPSPQTTYALGQEPSSQMDTTWRCQGWQVNTEGE